MQASVHTALGAGESRQGGSGFARVPSPLLLPWPPPDTAQCKFEFCWLCQGDWKEHGERTGGFYNCNKWVAATLRA